MGGPGALFCLGSYQLHLLWISLHGSRLNIGDLSSFMEAQLQVK